MQNYIINQEKSTIILNILKKLLTIYLNLLKEEKKCAATHKIKK
jgi:hypothetical protein